MRKQIEIQRVPAAEARQRLGQLIKQVYNRETRVIVEKGGIPVVAVVSLADFERWTRLDREREERFGILDEIGEAFMDVPAEEMEREVSQAIAEVREQQRRRDRRSA